MNDNNDCFNSNKFDKLIRGKNVNFLIGSGASVPMYPTLSFGKEFPSFEDVASYEGLNYIGKSFMYIYYFKLYIEIMSLSSDVFYKRYGNYETLKNYRRFINCLYEFLQNESNELPKRINIFTTNYDLVFERIFDDFIIDNPLVFFNDGSRGMFNKYISNKNFYLNVTHSGYNDKYRREVPTINLFKLHGSLSWEVSKIKGNEDAIRINTDFKKIEIINRIIKDLNLNSKNIMKLIDNIKSANLDEFVDSLNNIYLDTEKLKEFNEEYSKLAIINPNKYKFSETVLEQYYYQMIRSFSYELEKKQSVLIVFGFSFADEHIKDIFERSLLNPELIVIMICYSIDSLVEMKRKFHGYKNIIFLPDNFDKNSGNFDYLLKLMGGKNER